MKRKWLLLGIILLAVVIALAALFWYDVFGLRPTRCEVRRVTSEERALYLARQLGLDAVQFEYTVPAGVRLTAWVETYIDGKLDNELSRHFYISSGPEADGKPYSGTFSFERYYPESVSESPLERCRWEFFPGIQRGVNWWVNNPFKDSFSRGWGPQIDTCRLDLGQTKIVYYDCCQRQGTQKKPVGFPFVVGEAEEAKLLENMDVCVFVKIRFDKAGDEEAVIRLPQSGLPDFLREE